MVNNDKNKSNHTIKMKIDRACSLRRIHAQYFIDKRLNDHTSCEIWKSWIWRLVQKIST